MTTQQLWMVIGIPSVLVILSWIQQGSRLSQLEANFESLDRKFETLRSDMQRDMLALRSEMQREILALRNDMHREILALRNDMHRDMTTLRDTIHGDMVMLHERVAVVEAKNS